MPVLKGFRTLLDAYIFNGYSRNILYICRVIFNGYSRNILYICRVNAVIIIR